MNQIHNVAQEFKPTFWQKLSFKLFPARRIDRPPEEESGYTTGYMMTDATIVMDWIDRLRVLVSGKVMVETYTKTDVLVVKAYSKSVAYVLPPFWKVDKP